MARSIAAIFTFGLLLACVPACGDEAGVRSLDQVYGNLGGSNADPAGAAGAGAGGDFDIETTNCRVTSASMQLATSSGGTRSLAYTGCRAHWNAANRVLTWQMTTRGTTGSFSSPGESWINVSVHQDSKQNTTFPIARTASLLPSSVSVDEVVFAMTLDGRTVSARGSVRVGNNITDDDGKSGSLDLTFAGVTLVGATSATSLSGGISLVAGPKTVPSGGEECPPCDASVRCEITTINGGTSTSTFPLDTSNGVCGVGSGSSRVVFACGGALMEGGQRVGSWRNCVEGGTP